MKELFKNLKKVIILMVILCFIRNPNLIAQRTMTKDLNKDEVLRVLQDGFNITQPRIFFDQRVNEKNSRILLLLEYLECKPKYVGQFWSSTDGKTIIVEDISYTEAYRRGTSSANPQQVEYVIISCDHAPRVIHVPCVSYLDDYGELIAWKQEGFNPHEYIIHGGRKVWLKRPVFDNLGKYFGDGGLYFDYEKQRNETSPVYLYSFDEPNKPLVKSNLESPDKVFTTNDRVYLMGREPNKQTEPEDVHCEVYIREPERLILERAFTISCPRKWSTLWLVPISFDSENRQVLFRLDRDFFGDEWYLYDIDSSMLSKIGKTPPCFVDPELFKTILAETNRKRQK